MTEVRRWLSPRPLWALAEEDPNLERLMRPALLRFPMPAEPVAACQAALAGGSLAATVARPESRTQPGAGWEPYAAWWSGSQPLTLYQPAQGRCYLVAASLVGGSVPLLEAGPVAARGDRVGMVVRRVLANPAAPEDPPARTGAAWLEYAWTGDPGQGWQPAPAHSLHAGEGLLALFPIGSPPGIMAGLCPVFDREVYGAQRELPAGAADAVTAAVVDDFAARIIRPLAALRELAAGPEATAASVLLLLDLAVFLRQYFRDEASVLPLKPRWREAMARVWDLRRDLALGPAPELPGDVFDLRDVVLPEDLARLPGLLGQRLREGRERRICPPVPADPGQGPFYVVRCFYQAGGGAAEPVVSAPSEPFQMSWLYDGAAPTLPGHPAPQPPHASSWLGRLVQALLGGE